MSGTSNAERLFAAMEDSAGKTALVFSGRSYSFGDLDELSRRYAAGLAQAGIAAGDRVAVFAETCPETIIAMLGHFRLGALHVPVNTRYRSEEAEHILRDSGAKALLTAPESFAGQEAERMAPLENLRHRILLGAAAPSRGGDLVFDRLIESRPLPRGDRLPSDTDTAVLLYTSGTTGQSKGVELSYRAIVENTLAVTGLWRFSPADTLALALPLFHVHGLCLGICGSFLNRMTTLLFERFDTASIVQAFAAGGATVFQGVPTMYVKLLDEIARSPAAAAHLARGSLFTAGSAALSAEDFASFQSATGHRILERYGMSETLFTLSNPYEDRRPGTVGLPIPGCRVRIVDEAGRDIEGEEPGEVLVQGNGMMTGYWGRPAETAASFRDGWFVTGDMARRGPDGYVTIAGRKSVDFIKSGGFKIAAREIEDVLRRHAAVKDVAVVGAPDRVWGETIVAVVVLDPRAGPPPSEPELLEELSAFCARHLADYKRPRQVRIFEELPRNALGKVQKHRILESL